MTDAARRSRCAWRAPTFSASVASVRIRCLQIMEELGAMGLHVEAYTPSSIPYRAVTFCKAYDSSDLALATRLKREGTRVIFDICDDHVYGADAHPVLAERLTRLQRMLALADSVVVSTEALGRAMTRSFPSIAPKLVVIADALDPLIARPGSAAAVRTPTDAMHLWRLRRFLSRTTRSLKVVWFGNHGVGYAPSGMSDLLEIRPALERFASSHALSLTIISNSYRKYLSVSRGWQLPTCYVPWRIGSFREALSLHDVAVCPISLNPFTVAKSNNRPATAMLAGLGVIAQSIPSYEELRPFIWLNDWGGGLRAYADDGARETARLTEGRQFLTQHYSAARIADRWRRLLSPTPGAQETVE